MTYLKIKSFNNGKPIIFGLSRMATPYSVVMADTDVLPDVNGKKLVTEGSFVAQIGNATRFLPRTRLKNASATNSAALTLKAPSYAFKTGDVLYAQAGYAQVVFEGTFAQNDVYTVRIDGVNYSVTAPSTPTADTVVDAFISGNSAAFTTAKITATQRGTSGTIEIFAEDAHKIDVYSSNPAVNIRVVTTDPGYLGDHIIPLGTVQSIATANSSGERVVTLAANAAYVVPANVSVGVKVDKYLGIYPDPMDFTDEYVYHVAPIVECDGVYEQNLPYVDSQLKRVHDKLYINKRFYKAL